MINQISCIISSSAKTMMEIQEEKKGRFIMKRLKIAQYIAIAATIMSVISWMVGTHTEMGMVLMFFGTLGALVSYLLGGFRTAAEMASKGCRMGLGYISFSTGFRNVYRSIYSYNRSISVFTNYSYKKSV